MKKLLIIFTLFTMTYASNETNINTIDKRSDVMIENSSYITMSTEQLQEEVEKHSIKGDLSFNMGMELIRRWSKS